MPPIKVLMLSDLPLPMRAPCRIRRFAPRERRICWFPYVIPCPGSPPCPRTSFHGRARQYTTPRWTCHGPRWPSPLGFSFSAKDPRDGVSGHRVPRRGVLTRTLKLSEARILASDGRPQGDGSAPQHRDAIVCLRQPPPGVPSAPLPGTESISTPVWRRHQPHDHLTGVCCVGFSSPTLSPAAPRFGVLTCLDGMLYLFWSWPPSCWKTLKSSPIHRRPVSPSFLGRYTL